MCIRDRRHVVHDIFVDLNFVSFFGHGIEAGSHFVLTCGSDFVVMSFNYQKMCIRDSSLAVLSEKQNRKKHNLTIASLAIGGILFMVGATFISS